MENFSRRPGDDPGDVQPTQQFWPEPHTPAPGPGTAAGGFGGSGATPGWGGGTIPGPASPGTGPGGGAAPGPRPGLDAHLAEDRHKARRWAAGIAAAAVLAAGGLAVGLTLAGHSSPAGPSGQAATLNAVLSSADTGTAGTGTPGTAASATGTANTGGSTAAAGASGACARAAQKARADGRPRLARVIAFGCRRRGVVAALLRGTHGQFTFSTAGGSRTLAFERGTVSSVPTGHDMVVHASDGTTWTWHIVSTTVVRERGAMLTTRALSPGETVWVGGPVTQGAKDARLIVILPSRTRSPSTPSRSATPAG